MGDFYTNPVRHPEDTGVAYVRRTVSLADLSAPPTSAGVPIGALEAGAIPLATHVYIETAFNAGTTNVLDVGTSGTPAGFIPTATVVPGTTGYKTLATGTLAGIPLAADQVVYAKFSQTGTAATTGKAVISVTFLPKRDTVGIPWPGN
jgi:hypothetical protein